ncbi:hypothetical protein [uncultured Kordia sp.]|uniref:hypothetical protein n=1 Tax=uncultured Kordia sp. TaxID=507699 RepID=UPI00263265C9|nr:hypothetical protein [uncultured Kordia sp.]
MKTFKKQSRCFSVFLMVLFLFHSCSVYTPESSTLDEATTSNRRVKIHTKEGKRLRYKRIFKKEGLYYGIKMKDTIQIDTQNIERLRLKNNALSAIYTVLVSIVGSFPFLVYILWR